MYGALWVDTVLTELKGQMPPPPASLPPPPSPTSNKRNGLDLGVQDFQFMAQTQADSFFLQKFKY